MKKIFKIVRSNGYNSDQDLMSFFDDWSKAEQVKDELFAKYPLWIEDRDRLVAKPVNIEEITNPVCTDYMHYVRSLIPDEEWERVMKSDASAEIHSNSLMCGAGTYYYLSQMIDKGWTVVDIGVSYAAQSYLFQNHHRYIAVEPFPKDFNDWHFEMFSPPKMELFQMSGQKFIKDYLPHLNLDLNKTFAIVNYVPSDECCKMVRETFKNVWSYYPSL